MQARDYLTGTFHQVVKCGSCGLVYVNPQPDSTELGSYYPQIYYGDTPFLYEKVDANARFKRVRKLVTKGCVVLDIGCGRGLLLAKLHEVGCEVWGTELSQDSSRYAQQTLRLNIINRELADCDLASEHFDLITMFHSLEHMTSPRNTLKEIRRILKSGGVLVVEVPRFESLHSRLFKDKWFHLDVPRHLFHFSDRSLEQLLTTAGFKVHRKTYHDIMYDSFGALQSILNCLCSRQNLLNDLNTKRVTGAEITKSGDKDLIRDMRLSLVLQSILFVPLLLVSLFMSIFNSGCTLKYIARKQ